MRGTLGLLDNFSCGISVILIAKCGILPDLKFIKIFLIVISDLFVLNVNIQSSGFGVTSCLHSILKYCGIEVLWYFNAVLRSSEPPIFPSLIHVSLNYAHAIMLNYNSFKRTVL